MLDASWSFLRDPVNRELLSWIGGGLIVIISGVWSAFRFFLFKKRPDVEGQAKSISATGGGVAVDGGVHNSTIDTRGSKR